MSTDFSPDTKLELSTIVDDNHQGLVPKIRIRLRPQIDKSPNSVETKCVDSTKKAIQSEETFKSGILSSDLELRSYQLCRKDNYDMDTVEPKPVIHSINLRSRPPRIEKCPKIFPDKTNRNSKLLNRKISSDLTSSSKGSLKSVCNKSYKSFILKSSNDSTRANLSHSSIKRIERCKKRTFNKPRNDNLSNINLKELINHENFLKLPSEIQWQLVNLLPNCDKPKSLEKNGCQCSDAYDNKEFPNLSFSVLNNEFLGKALSEFSLKMGQCDLINFLNSERENLRSRPSATILNDDSVLKLKLEIEMKPEGKNCTDASSFQISEELLNSSTIDCASDIVVEGKSDKCEITNDLVFYETSPSLPPPQLPQSSSPTTNEMIIEINENIEMASDYPSVDLLLTDIPETEVSELVKKESLRIESVESNTIGSNVNEKSRITSSCIISNIVDNIVEALTKSEEGKRKRGRKRRTNLDDGKIVPVKRSNRSTAGKRPSRLDSESPPSSPLPPDKKNICKSKKSRDPNKNLKRSKIKCDMSSDDIEKLIRLESKGIESNGILLESRRKRQIFNDSFKFSKIYSSSPESLNSNHTESDLSTHSKSSPNSNTLLNSLCRSNLMSFGVDKKLTNHAGAIQNLSPSWSCTSESTTPSVKSDYGHPTTLKHVSNSAPEIILSNNLEIREVQGMPPPRQTLTLAAMREKMRAKKLAKGDNRKNPNHNNRRSGSFLNQKQRKQAIPVVRDNEDDLQQFEKMISSNEDFDELLNSQEVLLDFFRNCDFENPVDQTEGSFDVVNIKTDISKCQNQSRSPECLLNSTSTCCDRKSSKTIINPDLLLLHETSTQLSTKTKNCVTTMPDNSENEQQSKKSRSDNSIVETIATVIQKLNGSKENGIISNNNNIAGNANNNSKNFPNAYLVDSNGLTTALSYIQSLNPGSKVTTQQFYLVNSGPHYILQQSPPINNLSSEAGFCNSSTTTILPKSSQSLSKQSNVQLMSSTTNISDNINNPSSTDGGGGVGSGGGGGGGGGSGDHALFLKNTTITDTKNATIIVPTTSSNNNNNLSQTHSGAVHLQTISTSQPIGIVHSMQSQLPSLFPSQLRFIGPSISTPGTHQNTTISLLAAPNISNSSHHQTIAAATQSPKLLLFCPTVANNNPQNLSTISHHQEHPHAHQHPPQQSQQQPPPQQQQQQKYLLIAKPPDNKQQQSTIQLVTSQSLWQHFNNTNMISHQPNNFLVMQQPVKTVYDSFLCTPTNNSNTATTVINNSSDILQTTPSKILVSSPDCCVASTLIVDSRSSVTPVQSLENCSISGGGGSGFNELSPSVSCRSETFKPSFSTSNSIISKNSLFPASASASVVQLPAKITNDTISKSESATVTATANDLQQKLHCSSSFNLTPDVN